MTIGIVNGKPRTFKTAKIARLGLRRADAGELVYTNLALYEPDGVTKHHNVVEITPLDLLKILDKGRSDRRFTLLLHEVWAWFNSHRSTSGVNDCEGAVVYQLGKMYCDLFCDGQLIGKIDSSIKDNCNWRQEAVRMTAGCDPNEKCRGEACKYFSKCFIAYYWLDVHVRDRDVPIRGYPPELISIREMSKYWNRWNTWDTLAPIGFADMKMQLLRSDTELMDVEIDRQVGLLLENRGLWRKPLRTDVKSALLKLRVAPVFADIVACRLSLVMSQKPELA